MGIYPLVTVTITEAGAWVLFDFLTRFCETERLTLAHRAEEQSLWRLHFALWQLLGVTSFPLDRAHVEEARGIVQQLPEDVEGTT
jgi:hypothetical protein